MNKTDSSGIMNTQQSLWGEWKMLWSET